MVDYNYWIQSTSKVWVKVPSLTASATTTIYLVKEAGFTPSGANTFVYFDDFNTDNLATNYNYSGAGDTWTMNDSGDGHLKVTSDGGLSYCTTKTTFSPPFVMESLIDDSNNYIDVYSMFAQVWGINADGSRTAEKDGTNIYGGWCLYTNDIVSVRDYDGNVFLNGVYKAIIRSNSSETSVNPSGYTMNYTSADIPDSKTIGFVCYFPGTGAVDWMLVRKYASTEPSVVVTDEGSYYSIAITENSGSTLTNFQISLTGTSIGGLSTVTDSLHFKDSIGPDFTKLKINIGDVWKSGAGMQVNIGDSWKAVASMQINIGDAWKTVL